MNVFNCLNSDSLKVIGFTENELDARFITVRG